MSAQRSSSRLSSVCGIALLLLATLCCGDACERDTKISIEGGNPPTFRLSGNGNLAFLAVSDDSPNKVEKRSGEILWKIIPQMREVGKSVSYRQSHTGKFHRVSIKRYLRLARHRPLLQKGHTKWPHQHLMLMVIGSSLLFMTAQPPELEKQISVMTPAV